MTVLIGVLCKDGVVVGADSAATFGVGQIRTVEQTTTKKIEVIDRRIIVAGTGAVGMQQRFVYIVQGLSEKRQFTGDKVDEISATKTLSSAMILDMRSTHMNPGSFGALVAFPIGRKLHLCEFPEDTFQPELKTASGLWYVSMGSGIRICDPFLGFLREIFWTAGQPSSCQEGIFAAVWAIEHAITVNPGGINGPVRVATLTLDEKDQPQARMLDESELEEHRENVRGAKKHLKEYADTLRMKGVTPSKPIPEP